MYDDRDEIGIKIVQISDGSTLLSINSVEARHAGTYTCVAKNEAGKETYTSNLVVNGIFIKII